MPDQTMVTQSQLDREAELDALESHVLETLRRARKAGATSAEASAHTSQGLSVAVRLGEVETLETAINRCREKHGQTGFEYGGEQLLALTAYMAFVSRGNPINVTVSSDDEGAMAAYEKGKQFYYTKRGQLNLSCFDCHVTSVGQYVRADHLSASLGHPTHFPVYRSKLGGMISLQQRFSGCVRDVRAKPFALQSREFRNLEYFLTFMSNGLEVNGPGARK